MVSDSDCPTPPAMPPSCAVEVEIMRTQKATIQLMPKMRGPGTRLSDVSVVSP